MKKILVLLICFMMIFTLAACGGSDSSEEPAPAEEPAADETATDDNVYEMKVNWENDPENFMTKNWDKWLHKLEDLSGGRLKATIYYSNTLLDANAEMQQLEAGVGHLADAKRTAADGFIISEGWKLLTAGVKPEEQVSKSYEFCEAFPEVMDEFSRVKVVAQSYTGGSGYSLLTVSKKVEKPADMAGMNIWCEPDWNEFVKLCGATPVNTPWSEVYSSLQKNMYDGIMIPAETLQSVNFAEVCKYCTLLEIYALSGPGYYMNLDFYNSLPDDLKALIDDPELIGELEEANRADGIAIQDGAMKWATENYGTEYIYPTDEAMAEFKAALNESKATLAKKLDDQGKPGTEMVEWMVNNY